MTINVDQFAALLGGDRNLEAAFARARIAKEGIYDEFVERLYDDLDEVIYSLQRNPELLQGDVEDRITLDLLRPLRHLGYSAEHDSKTGGHVDLTVGYGTFTWIGEAKKDGNFAEGFLQLMTRYRPGSGNFAHNAGGLLFYLIKSNDAKGELEKWMEELKGEALSCAQCKKNVLAFFSEHKLAGSGTTFRVRTMAVSLYHQPMDKSGRTTRARRTAKAEQRATAEKAARSSAPKQSTKSAAGRKKAP